MRRPSSPYASSFSFGFSPLSSAMKLLIGANVVVFVAQLVLPAITEGFGLHPAWVVPSWLSLRPEHSLWIWQLATYMFLHGGLFHILFNMLALWMFGAELERIWGTRYFLKFYFVTGIGSGVLTVIVSLLPFEFARQLQLSNVIGASGAIYGLLLAYAMYFPDRPIYMYLLFPIPAKIFVLIMGAIALYSSVSEAGGVANATHLGGLLVAYLYLKGGRAHPLSEIKYRYLKWKINRVRKKFDVYSGGRANDWDRRVH
jgi:membrane associated rhomboid family serine protease